MIKRQKNILVYKKSILDFDELQRRITILGQ